MQQTQNSISSPFKQVTKKKTPNQAPTKYIQIPQGSFIRSKAPAGQHQPHPSLNPSKLQKQLSPKGHHMSESSLTDIHQSKDVPPNASKLVQLPQIQKQHSYKNFSRIRSEQRQVVTHGAKQTVLQGGGYAHYQLNGKIRKNLSSQPKVLTIGQVLVDQQRNGGQSLV